MKYYLEVLKKYAVFNGRASRKEYWMFFLFNIFAYFIIGLTEGFFGIFPNSDDSVLGSIYQLFIFIPSISVGVRRMHDVGKSGGYLLIPIYSYILTLTDGDGGDNKYGPDPKIINVGEKKESITDNLSQKTESIFCRYCGKPIEANSKFCTNCGKSC